MLMDDREGGSLTHCGLGSFYPLCLQTNRSGYEKLVSLGPLLKPVGPGARSWWSVARKSPTAEFPLITAQYSLEKQRQ